MEPPHPVVIRWQGKTVGPFSLEQLRELSASGAITPTTEVAPEADGPWARIDALPLGAVLFPPAPAVGFKVPDYDRANHPAQPPIDLNDLIAAANRPLAAPPGGATPAPPPPPASAPHDVHSLLQFNYELDRKRGLFHLPPAIARPSRRRRDYFILLFGIGGLIFTVLGFEAVLAVSLQVMAAKMLDQFWPILNMVLFHSPIMAWGLAAFFTYWVALTWLMFGLMDDY